MAVTAEDALLEIRERGLAELPEHVRLRSVDRLLDALSTAAGAVAINPVGVSAAFAAFGPKAGTSGMATVIGSNSGASVGAASFINAVAIHSILFEDIMLSSSDHPGPVICAAALATAEEHDATFEQLLRGIVVGYETQLLLGAIGARDVIGRGFRTTSVLGAVGAAATAASIRELPERSYLTALSLAANGAAGLMEPWAHGTCEPYLQAGGAAAVGVFSTDLAVAGADAAPITFSGANGFMRAFMGDIKPLPDDLQQWRIMDVSCKPYPISGAKTTTVDTALVLQARGLDTANIDRIVAHMPIGAVEPPGCDRRAPFESPTQAQDSAPFCIAAAICGRDMEDTKTFFDGYADEEVGNLTARIELVGERDRQLGQLTIIAKDGSELTDEADHRSNQVPSVDKMSAKLRRLGVGVWSPATIEQIVDVVCGDGAQPVRNLTPILRAV
jgi:2-methylcitrate dehydratase PrpD